ncbi:MAG: protein kinase, partial [Gammaproteobacteria bacterium]|nr:protein kinase [Gammaproteobacteria bacterium]
MPPPPPRETNPDLSPALEAVILKALAKEAEDRYPTGAALAEALDEALQPGQSVHQEIYMSPKEEIQKLIAIKQRRLQKLREKEALRGMDTPPDVLIEIEDLEAEIEHLEEELATEPVNQEMGPYRLATRMGLGGMAQVYRAYDSKLARFVAIKVLHHHLSQNEAFVDRFYNEAITVAKLKHPNIVRVHDYGFDRDKYYMVMELVDGDTLAKKLERRRTKSWKFSLVEASKIFEELAAAIDYAHAKEVVHHDLKPDNIMFAEDKRVMLTDFGIAHLANMAHQTATGARLGTPAYMAPEQVQGRRGDTRSDIYALGVILYEMVTGNEPTPLLIDEGNVSPAIKEIILKALSKNPNDRYQTAGEMAEALES